MQVIIFPNENGGVAVMYPALEYADQIETIAVKDVPAGKPWRIVDESELPDRNTRDRWEWTASGPLTVGAEVIAVPQSISFAQLLIGLVTEGWITEAEGDAWADGTLPAGVLALIAQLPANQQFAARTRAKRPSEVLRLDPLVAALAAAQSKTPEEIDQFFRTYSGV